MSKESSLFLDIVCISLSNTIILIREIIVCIIITKDCNIILIGKMYGK